MSNFFEVFKQRDYQIEIMEKLYWLYEKQMHINLVRAFTGAGKTTGVAAFLPQKFPFLMDEGPLIFLSHRREIIYHAYSKFVQIYPDKFIGLEMGEREASGLEDMIFISVDSLGRMESDRMKKYVRIPKIVLCDEGHHVKKDGTWDRILNAFGVGSSDTPYAGGGLHPLVVFLTATPNRGDGLTLGHWVQNWRKDDEIDYNLDYGVDNGWLVRPELFDLHLQNAHYGSMSSEEKAAVLCKVKAKFAVGLQTLIFAGNVAESKIVKSTLQELGIGKGVGEVYGESDKAYRDHVLEQFRPGGEIETITNRLVLTEGYDNPWIQAIIDGGFTTIDSLFEQKVGRGLRPWVDLKSGNACIFGHDTAADRLNAIAESPKPTLPYFTTYDTGSLELSPSISLHVVDDNDQDTMPTCMPVIDVILYEDAVDDQMPPRNWEDLDNIELFAVRRDVFTGTVFNKKLHAISPLRWIIDEDKGEAYLWIEGSKKNGTQNPLSLKDTSTIWAIKRIEDRKWQLHVVDVGGWSDSVGHAVRASYEQFGESNSFSGLLNQLDNTLRDWDKKQYQACRREAFPDDPATPQDLKYLKQNQIPFGSGITRRTVQILKDDFRIRTSLEKLKLLG